ncbi:MAG: hypothetical protein K6360_05685 [Deltaproteobacteria bacterium]
MDGGYLPHGTNTPDVSLLRKIAKLSSYLTDSGINVKGESVATQKLPQPNALCSRLLAVADIRLPHVLPLRKTQVTTRQKLTTRRKKLKKSTD